MAAIGVGVNVGELQSELPQQLVRVLTSGCGSLVAHDDEATAVSRNVSAAMSRASKWWGGG
jgi:hypothetical protein